MPLCYVATRPDFDNLSCDQRHSHLRKQAAEGDIGQFDPGTRCVSLQSAPPLHGEAEQVSINP